MRETHRGLNHGMLVRFTHLTDSIVGDGDQRGTMLLRDEEKELGFVPGSNLSDQNDPTIAYDDFGGWQASISEP